MLLGPPATNLVLDTLAQQLIEALPEVVFKAVIAG